MLDIEAIRKETIGCTDKIFLDSAGSSLMPNCVVDSVVNYLKEEALNGGYHVKESNEDLFEEFYSETARLLNCHPQNISFTHDATDAYAKALSSISFEKGDIIITSNDDYISNQINFISLHRRYGVEIKRIKNLENGDLDLNHFNELINESRPKLVAVTQIPTNSGLIQDVAAVGEICFEKDILYLIDACQTAGQISIDLSQTKCDFLSVTGRKFLRGPRGSGFLYVSDKLLKANYHPLHIDMRGADWTSENEFEFLHQSAKRFETWESPYALIVGLKEAIKYANEIGMAAIENYNQKLVDQLRTNLDSLNNIRVLDRGSKKCNIVTFHSKKKSLEETQAILRENNVYYSVSKREYNIIDFEVKNTEWAIRISPHYFNTMKEMEQVSEIISSL